MFGQARLALQKNHMNMAIKIKISSAGQIDGMYEQTQSIQPYVLNKVRYKFEAITLAHFFQPSRACINLNKSVFRMGNVVVATISLEEMRPQTAAFIQRLVK